MELHELCAFFKTGNGIVEIQAVSQEAVHTWNFRCHGMTPLGWENKSIKLNGRFIGQVIQITQQGDRAVDITFDRDPNATQLARFIETCVANSLNPT